MAIEKVELKTRLMLRYDTWENWSSSNAVLEKGEVAVATVTTPAPAVVLKVGDGAKTFKQLDITAARAADVYNWAKQEKINIILKGPEDGNGIASITSDGNGLTVTRANFDLKGAAADVQAALEKKIGTLPEGSTDVISYINDKTSGIATDGQIKEINKKLDILNGSAETAGSVAEAKKAGTDAQANLTAYQSSNDSALAEVKSTADTAASDLSAFKTTVADTYATKTALGDAKTALTMKMTKDTSEAETNGVIKYKFQQGTDPEFVVNVPKDLVVSKGEIKIVEQVNVPYQGAQVGDKYIDLTLNDTQKDHIYIPVKELVDTYTGKDGTNITISVSETNEISAVLKNGTVTNAQLAGSITQDKLESALSTKIDTIAENTAAINKLRTDVTDGTITAKKAEQDAQGNVIATFYAKQSDYASLNGTVSGHTEKITALEATAQGLGTASTHDHEEYATAAQGTLAGTATQGVTADPKGGLTATTADDKSVTIGVDKVNTIFYFNGGNATQDGFDPIL